MRGTGHGVTVVQATGRGMVEQYGGPAKVGWWSNVGAQPWLDGGAMWGTSHGGTVVQAIGRGMVEQWCIGTSFK